MHSTAFQHYFGGSDDRRQETVSPRVLKVLRQCPLFLLVEVMLMIEIVRTLEWLHFTEI
jgi:hypothetical protein